jgi:type III pantothenate kinase
VVVVNVGNTNVRLVGFEGDEKVSDERIPTAEAHRATPGLPAGTVAMVSVVPAAADALAAAWEREGREVFRLTAGATGLAVDYDPPTGMGADRLANALAMWTHHGPGIAVDCGTATTLTLVDTGGVVRGGAILPGLGTARDSLWKGTAQLPSVPLEPAPRAVGRSTLESLQIGLVDGHVGAIGHLAVRMAQAFPGCEQLVVTGGWGGLVGTLLMEHADVVLAPDLTIEGTRLAWAASRRGG